MMMMRRFVALVTLMTPPLLFTVVGAQGRHDSPPMEVDIVSEVRCQLNADGFGGNAASDVFTMDYNYELEVLGEPDEDQMETVVFSVERKLADCLLESTYFDDADCNSLPLVASIRSGGRALNPVGITINPPDEVTDISCDRAAAAGNTCAVILGQLQIYTEGIDQTEEALGAGLTSEIASCLEKGSVDGDYAHEDIVRVSYVADLDVDRVDGANEQEIEGEELSPRRKGNYVAIVVGSTVLVCCMIVSVAACCGCCGYYGRHRDEPDEESRAINE